MAKPKPIIAATVTIDIIKKRTVYNAKVRVAVRGHSEEWGNNTAWSRKGSLDALHRAVEKLNDRVTSVKRGRSPKGDVALNYFRQNRQREKN